MTDELGVSHAHRVARARDTHSLEHPSAAELRNDAEAVKVVGSRRRARLDAADEVRLCLAQQTEQAL